MTYQRAVRDIVVAIGLLLAAVTGAASARNQPNFLFIIADDCTFRDIGCYGGQAHTPNIDRLATEGLRMTRCFQAAPMCSPTRQNIYTGLYPVKSGAYPNHTFVKPGVRSIVHYLKPLGYRVALSGKKHISPPSAFPFEYSGAKGIDMKAAKSLFEECHESKTPFCLFACSNEPHSPWNKGDASRYPPANVTLPPYFVDTPATRTAFSKYLAEITVFDDQVGELLDLLEESGQAENTLVMVVSEQGNSFPFAKWTLYDSGLQSAMVVRWPEQVEPGAASDAMVEYVDILPTFVEIAGGTPSEELDGQSMLPVIKGESDQHKDYVYGIQTSRGIYAGPDHYGRRSVRSTDFKLIHNLDPAATFTNTTANTKFFKQWKAKAAAGDRHAKKLVELFHSPPEFELFDVVNDPLEQRNLIDQPEHAAVVQDLKEHLAAWMDAQGDRGQATEMAAIDRMLSGNKKVKQAIRNRRSEQ